jgi:hypothetical protein
MSDGHQLNEKLKEADIQQVGQYMKMFDRMLLYTMASNIMCKEDLESIIKLWLKTVKRNIDSDSNKRTTFLEETITGRKAKYNQEPDGEDLRLHCLKQLDLTQDIICSNLFRHNEED